MSSKVETSAPRSQSLGEYRSVFQLGGCSLVIYGLYNLFIILAGQGNTAQELTAKISAASSIFPVLFIGSLLTLLGPISDGMLVKWTRFQSLVKYFVLLIAFVYLLSVPFSLFTIYNIDNINSNAVKRLSTRLEKRRDEILKSISTITDNAAFAPTLSQFPELSSDIYLPPGATPDAVRAAIGDGIERGIEEQIKKLKQSQILGSIRLRRICRSNSISSLICGISFLSLASRVHPWLMSTQIKLQKFTSSIFSKSATSSSSSSQRSGFSKLIKDWQEHRRRRNIYLRKKKDELRYKKKAGKR